MSNYIMHGLLPTSDVIFITSSQLEDLVCSGSTRPRDLFRISPTISFVGMWETAIVPFRQRSLTNRVSTCFERWWTEFCYNCLMQLSSSSSMFTGYVTSQPIDLNNFNIQSSSWPLSAREIYSASVFDMSASVLPMQLELRQVETGIRCSIHDPLNFRPSLRLHDKLACHYHTTIVASGWTPYSGTAVYAQPHSNLPLLDNSHFFQESMLKSRYPVDC